MFGKNCWIFFQILRYTDLLCAEGCQTGLVSTEKILLDSGGSQPFQCHGPLRSWRATKGLPNLALGNCRETKGICAHLDLWIRYLSSNKRKYDQFRHGQISVSITHIVAPVFCNIVTYLWAKSCRYFGLKDLMWLKSAQMPLKITYFHGSTEFTSVGCRRTTSFDRLVKW